MAYVKISDLNFAQTLTGNEILPVVQNGTSYKVSVSAVGGTGDTENINGRCNDISTGSNYSSIVGGEYNDVYGNCSFIGGGTVNVLSADFGFIGGGTGNIGYSIGGFIGAGAGNDTCPNTCLDTIGGGNGNVVNSGFKLSFIGGGRGNFMETGNTSASADSNFNNQSNTIVGGSINSIGTKGNPLKGLPAMTKALCFNTIVGGYFNKISKFGAPLNPLPAEDLESKYSFVGGGLNNGINGNYTTIVGGSNNKVYSGVKGGFIGSGAYNTVRSVSGTTGGNYSSIVGGKQNQLSADFGFIGGGRGNIVSSASGTIGGGYGNSLSSVGGFIGGGLTNTIESGLVYSISLGQSQPAPSIIVGGVSNEISDSPSSFIGGGEANKIDGSVGTGNIIVGGYINNIVGGLQSVIIGGGNNILSGTNICCLSNSRNFIGGGTSNIIIGRIKSQSNAILAGEDNQIGPETESGGVASIDYSVIAGGRNNQIKSCGDATTSFIGAGQGNSLTGTNFAGNSLFANVSGLNNAVVAGYDVDIYGCQSFIGSGFLNTICGDYSSIITGCSNNNNHNNSHIVGSDITTVSGNMLHANTLYLSAAALPTSDPGVSGVVWRDGTDLKISL